MSDLRLLSDAMLDELSQRVHAETLRRAKSEAATAGDVFFDALRGMTPHMPPPKSRPQLRSIRGGKR